MADTALEAIIAAAGQVPAAPSERLTTSAVFVQYGRMGVQVQQLVEAFKRIPDSPPSEIAESLKQIIKSCATIAGSAQRLLESNK